MIMLLPGVGEMTVPTRVRLVTALVLSAILLPVHHVAYQTDLNSLGSVILMVF